MMNQLNNLLELVKKVNESLSGQITGIRSSLTSHIEATAKSTLDNLDLILKQNEVIKELSENNAKLTEKCYAIEIIQLRLFSALAETNPSVHSKIVEEMTWMLDQRKDQMEGQEDLAHGIDEYIRTLVGIKAESKPLLRLVKKQVAPDSGAE